MSNNLGFRWPKPVFFHGFLVGGSFPTHLKNMRKSNWVHLPQIHHLGFLRKLLGMCRINGNGDGMTIFWDTNMSQNDES